MSTINPSPTSAADPSEGLILGLDIGGTKTSGVLAGTGSPLTPLFSARAASANVQNVTRAEALAALQGIAESLDSQSSGWRTRVVSAVAGAGGADTSRDIAELRELLSQALGLPQGLFTVVHDAPLILAAARRTEGIAVILGTGSAAWGRNEEGQTSRAGGWGHLLGDEASAYWLGREALRGTLLLSELGNDDDALARGVRLKAGVEDSQELIAAFIENQSRSHWAGFASCVFEAEAEGSEKAAEIVESGVELACEMVARVADALGSSGPVVFGGGVIQHQPGFAQRIRERLAADGLEPMIVLDAEPVIGALHLAAKGLGLQR